MKKLFALFSFLFLFTAIHAQVFDGNASENADWGPFVKGKVRVWHHSLNTKSDQSGIGFRFRRFTVDSIVPVQMPFGLHYHNLVPYVEHDPVALHYLNLGIRWEKNQHIALWSAAAATAGILVASYFDQSPYTLTNGFLIGAGVCWCGVLTCHAFKRYYVYRSIAHWDDALDKGSLK